MASHTDRPMQPCAGGVAWFCYDEKLGPVPCTARPTQLRSIGRLTVVEHAHAGRYEIWLCDHDRSLWAKRVEEDTA
jgi:hypothetical protein